MRKPFNIGDKVYKPVGSGAPTTLIGKTLEGKWLHQYASTGEVYTIHDPSLWEHYVELKVGYVNIYETSVEGVYFAGAVSQTRAEADGLYNSKNRIACIKITFKEGQFDD